MSSDARSKRKVIAKLGPEEYRRANDECHALLGKLTEVAHGFSLQAVCNAPMVLAVAGFIADGATLQETLSAVCDAYDSNTVNGLAKAIRESAVPPLSDPPRGQAS